MINLNSQEATKASISPSMESLKILNFFTTTTKDGTKEDKIQEPIFLDHNIKIQNSTPT
jgi:hypothetical protein